MGDKEDAVAAVEAAFRDAHKSAEKALMDATQLLQTWIRSCRSVGLHPNYSSSVVETLTDAIEACGSAINGLAAAHGSALWARDKAIELGLLPPIILPQGGGGGPKGWP